MKSMNMWKVKVWKYENSEYDSMENLCENLKYEKSECEINKSLTVKSLSVTEGKFWAWIVWVWRVKYQIKYKSMTPWRVNGQKREKFWKYEGVKVWQVNRKAWIVGWMLIRMNLI